MMHGVGSHRRRIPFKFKHQVLSGAPSTQSHPAKLNTRFASREMISDQPVFNLFYHYAKPLILPSALLDDTINVAPITAIRIQN